MYAGRDLKPRIKKSKHICENQGTAAFLHTNKLISVWNKMRLPRKKKKKWLSSRSPSHLQPNGFWDVVQPMSTPGMWGGVCDELC